MHIFLKDLVNYFNALRSPVYAVFIDVKKAYDRIHHGKLFNKLLSRGIPIYIVKIIAFWYMNQQIQIRWGQQYSVPFHVTNGIRQGGLISAAFFNLYMEDLTLQLAGTKVGCKIGKVIINHLAYADDMVLLAPSPIALRVLLNICDTYSCLNNILYSTEKTLCMIFWPRRFKFKYNPIFMIQGEVLNYTNEFKYLGVLINPTLSDNSEIVKRAGKMYAAGNTVMSKFKNCSIACKILMFQTYCSNVYASALWCNFNVFSYQRIKVAHNDVFRMLLNERRGPNHSISRLFVENRVNNLDSIIRVAVYSLTSRIMTSENQLVVAVREGSPRIHSRLWRQWGIVLRRDARQDLLFFPHE